MLAPLLLGVARLAVSVPAPVGTAAPVQLPPFEIAPGVLMPAVSLGHPDDKGSETASAELWLKLGESQRMAPFALSVSVPHIQLRGRGDAGGRGIDTAFDYHNQAQVGAAVKSAIDSGITNRSSIFLTTKISPSDCTEQAALAAVKVDLEQIGVKQVDLVLHHFPCNTEAGSQAVWKGE